METPLELSPKSPLEVLDDALNAVMPNLGALNSLEQPTPPPRNKANTRGLGLIFLDIFMKYFPTVFIKYIAETARASIASSSAKMEKQTHKPLVRLLWLLSLNINGGNLLILRC